MCRLVSLRYLSKGADGQAGGGVAVLVVERIAVHQEVPCEVNSRHESSIHALHRKKSSRKPSLHPEEALKPVKNRHYLWGRTWGARGA